MLEAINNPILHAIALNAKNLFRADWAGIALIFDEVQEVIASSGGRLGRYDRARSLAAHAILSPLEVLCLADAKEDGRFGANPFVRVDLIRYFVAAPIIDAQGYALGALCASSRFPRQVTDPDDLEKLQALAAQVAPTSSI
ncbi:GAF domain-containing protein [Sphingomonas sp. S-NIH.Pt15_0812]|uniref:GAF domain-containing protein n=1 Tax=Sphingomonas sp. S-NIH.Pt15_0812 TaxID=1920129 RepID=UPI0013DF950D|nr:GAF domain-containing protein [Sphingomonas sp. S-NIH.Pt15_0812]